MKVGILTIFILTRPLNVTALVDIILGKADALSHFYDFNAADMNGDGKHTVTDVTAIVDIILGK